MMTVLVMVTEALRPTALPFKVTIATLPTVENETADEAMMVPSMVPPPAPLIVAEVPTRQKMFLDWAPLIRMMLRGAAGAPTVSVLAVWNTQVAFGSPWP